ncbi:MAG: hypothetical protein HY329_10985, partial [Chloroflexi bacterium]|nr:hypothetical protein [Chloroflexota bacterium]
DNTLLASIVNVFPEAMRNTAPGQRPMDLGNLMTNATIDKVEGDGFTVVFPGGGAMVKLAPDAQIGKFAIGTVADLKEGATVSALVNNGAAQSVSLR